MNEDKMIFQDSYGEKTDKGNLKVYLDMKYLKDCELKLKNFMKVKNFIKELHKVG